MEQGALEYFRRIDEIGGVLAGIDQGFFQREIAEAAYRYQEQLERKEKVMVGVNDLVSSQPIDIPDAVRRSVLREARQHRGV